MLCPVLRTGWEWSDTRGSSALYKNSAVRCIVQEEGTYIPLDSWSSGAKGPGAGEIESPIRRSGVDSAGCSVAGPTLPWASMGSISFLVSLRARRWLLGRRRNFGNFMLSLDDGAIREKRSLGVLSIPSESQFHTPGAGLKEIPSTPSPTDYLLTSLFISHDHPFLRLQHLEADIVYDSFSV